MSIQQFFRRSPLIASEGSEDSGGAYREEQSRLGRCGPSRIFSARLSSLLSSLSSCLHLRRFTAALTGAALALFLAGCQEDPQAALQKKTSSVLEAAPRAEAAESAEQGIRKAIERVETVDVLKNFPAAYEIAGSVAADERIDIASRIPALIRELTVKEGDAVKAGDVLVRLDDTEIEAAVRAAEAKVRIAEAAARDAKLDAEKLSRLFQSGFISDFDLRKANLKRDAAKSDLEEAQSLLTQAKNQRAYAVLKSPIDGRIAKRLRRAGDLAAPAFPILVVESERAPRFEIHVPESRRASIAVGDRAAVSILDRSPVGATVELVSASADPLTRTFLVRLKLDDAVADASTKGRTSTAVFPGEFGRARFEMLPTERSAVPKSAIATRGGIDGVFVLREVSREGVQDAENHRAEAAFTWLRLGREALVKTDRGEVPVLEVLAGLKGGERLIDKPNPRLADGDAVEIQEKSDRKDGR